jgi:hypothetical protein
MIGKLKVSVFLTKKLSGAKTKKQKDGYLACSCTELFFSFCPSPVRFALLQRTFNFRFIKKYPRFSLYLKRPTLVKSFSLLCSDIFEEENMGAAEL